MGFRGGRFWARPVVWGLGGFAGLVAGCASPGTPKAPSLRLPQAVQDLAAMREGDAVQVRFTVPARTTDGVGIRGATVNGVLCRQDEKAGPCQPVDGEETAGPLGLGQAVVWRDVLPPGLLSGSARAMAYRVELRNAAGKSAGYSEAAYAAAGDTPPTVEGLVAEGVRSGVLLTWHAAAGPAELLVRREQMDGVISGRGGAGVKGESGATRRRARGARAGAEEDAAVVWLKLPVGGPDVPEVVDGTIEESVRYRYTAVRSATVRLGGRMLEVRSAPSAEVEIAWKDVYPPAAPQGLTALGYEAALDKGGAPGYAVDLVWEPVSDPRVTGYAVMRQRVGAGGQAVGAAAKLTPEPISTPGFHDASAMAGGSYRYEVMAVDAKGNVSAPAVATVGPTR